MLGGVPVHPVVDEGLHPRRPAQPVEERPGVVWHVLQTLDVPEVAERALRHQVVLLGDFPRGDLQGGSQQANCVVVHDLPVGELRAAGGPGVVDLAPQRLDEPLPDVWVEVHHGSHQRERLPQHGPIGEVAPAPVRGEELPLDLAPREATHLEVGEALAARDSKAVGLAAGRVHVVRLPVAIAVRQHDVLLGNPRQLAREAAGCFVDVKPKDGT
mmetsp:Transcript_88230/g.234283  ORF Transcript_88230/g.234283 Transcript_88230/m.234283 type:complete len:214 (-) Transcript_88230:440-1081(-)